jgi:hypothetical protein
VSTTYPTNFSIANESLNKGLNVVLCIDGLDFCFGMGTTYKKVVYGDPAVYYGKPGIVYGGLIADDSVSPYISLDSSLTLQQRLEPEQGRSSTSTLTFVLVDKNQEVSQIISGGGGILSEILGRGCIVRAGFINTSFPEDYFVVFRGTITNVVVQSGKISLTISDGNQRRRQAVFSAAKTKLTASLSGATAPGVFENIPVIDTSGFSIPILGPSGGYDSGLKLYVRIGDEFLEYDQTSFTPTQFYAERGSRGSAVEAHSIDDEVTNALELEGNAIDLALKIMLSGWGGPWIEGIVPQALGTKIDPAIPAVPRAVVLPEKKDAFVDYGLTAGDFVTISGSTVGNNGTYQILDFDSNTLGQNNVLLIDQDLILETGNPALELAFRSKYDTLPDACGLKLTPNDVDVARHEELKNTYLGDSQYTLRLFIQDQVTGKEFIEKEIYYPVGAYALTRFGRLSVGLTKPPIAGAELQFLNVDNVLEPQNMTITRGLNNRRFFNQIQYEYDPTDDGKYQYIVRSIDTDSLEEIGQTTLLPIKAAGVRQDLGGAGLSAKSSQYLLQRYKRAAFEIRMTVNFTVGIKIEAGDVVAIQDNGQLQLLNFDTGVRNLGVSLFEVIDRTLDLKTGRVSLVLLSGIGAQYTDRFATIAPSSRLTALSSIGTIEIEDSYGAIFPGAEYDKWTDYVGQEILVHRDDWSAYEVVTFVGFEPGFPYRMNVSPPLSFVPQAGDIVEIPEFPTSTNPADGSLYKAIHAFLDPTTPVISADDPFTVTVSPAEIYKFKAGQTILVHEPEWVTYSPEVKIASVDVGTATLTVEESLTYTPAAGDLIELTGFADGSGPYRFI